MRSAADVFVFHDCTDRDAYNYVLGVCTAILVLLYLHSPQKLWQILQGFVCSSTYTSFMAFLSLLCIELLLEVA